MRQITVVATFTPLDSSNIWQGLGWAVLRRLKPATTNFFVQKLAVKEKMTTEDYYAQLSSYFNPVRNLK